MTENMDLYDGTLWPVVLDFNGPYYDIENDKRVLINEEPIRVMTELEKKLYTLWQKKTDERDDLIKSICGIHPRSVSGRMERVLYSKALADSSNDEQKLAIDLLWKQAEFFRKAMWLFISATIRNKNHIPFLYMKLRPGWKVVIGQKSGTLTKGLAGINHAVSEIHLS